MGGWDELRGWLVLVGSLHVKESYPRLVRTGEALAAQLEVVPRAAGQGAAAPGALGVPPGPGAPVSLPGALDGARARGTRLLECHSVCFD
jgi:hypothetical protein